MSERVFQSAIARYIWESRYRYRRPVGDGDASPADTWQRVAHALRGRFMRTVFPFLEKVLPEKDFFAQQRFARIQDDLVLVHHRDGSPALARDR